MRPLLVAQLCSHSAEGHGRYRVHGPGRALARLPGVTVVDCDSYHRAAEWLFESADVLVLHGVNAELLPVVRRRRAAGRVTMLEACDNYFDAQAWNPHAAGWLDRGLHDQFWQLAAAVDSVQTSTEALAEMWRRRARRVDVFENGLDAVPPLSPPPPRPLTVGWAGSLTHLADWFETAPVLEQWVRDHPGTRLAVMTDERAAGFVRLPPDRYLFRRAGSWDAYREFLGELDVGVVPLLPSPFNRGRTDLKFLEYAAHGVVGVYAAVPPYLGAVRPGETGLLYNSKSELTDALDRLAADPDLRGQFRSAAHAVAAERTAERAAARRSAVYQELLGDLPPAPDLPDGLVALADRDGRYFSLKPGEPENIVAAAQGVTATPARVADLQRVVASFPEYAVAARVLARMANDLGRHVEAVGVAGRLTDRRPDSPAAWTELARAHAGTGDAPAARYAVGRALVANPGHPGAWAVAAQLDGAGPGAAALGNRMARCQPENHLAALAAVRCLPRAEQRPRLSEILDRHAPTFSPDERPEAAAAFGEAFAAVVDPADREWLDVLGRAVGAFPESARLADLHGRALYEAGDADTAAAAFARAAGLARIGRAYRLDGAAVAGREFVWQVCDYLLRWRGQ